MLICYTTLIDEDTSGDLEKFNSVIQEITRDPEYALDMVFEKVTLEEYNALKVSAFKERTFLLRFSTEETIARTCHFQGLSCADSETQTIYINETNWNKGDKTYREYVIAHEIAHLLGYGHTVCSGVGNRGSVTQEFTRIGWGGCLPTRYI